MRHYNVHVLLTHEYTAIQDVVFALDRNYIKYYSKSDRHFQQGNNTVSHHYSTYHDLSLSHASLNLFSVLQTLYACTQSHTVVVHFWAYVCNKLFVDACSLHVLNTEIMLWKMIIKELQNLIFETFSNINGLSNNIYTFIYTVTNKWNNRVSPRKLQQKCCNLSLKKVTRLQKFRKIIIIMHHIISCRVELITSVGQLAGRETLNHFKHDTLTLNVCSLGGESSGSK